MSRNSGSTSVLPMPHRISFTKRSPTASSAPPTPTASSNSTPHTPTSASVARASPHTPSPSPPPAPPLPSSPASSVRHAQRHAHQAHATTSPAAQRQQATPAADPRDPSTLFSGSWLTPAHPSSRPLPTSSSRVHTPGMANLGNTCFMNAALQCLLHSPPLASILIRPEPHNNHFSSSSHSSSPRHHHHHHQQHASSNTRRGAVAPFCTFCALQALARSAHGPQPPRVLSPLAFARNTRSLCSTFKQGRQEDAHEFIRALLDAMVRAEVRGCGSVMPAQWDREASTDIHRVFGGALQSAVTCKQCDYASTMSEPFLDLSLEILKVGSVVKALSKFTAPESLDGDNRYRCDACKKLVVAVKRLTVRRAPNVLTLHLKRFDRMKKDCRFIDFPEVLDLGRYMFGKPNNVKVLYELTGVVVHQGASRTFGHYYAYVKTADGAWLMKDDSSSRSSSLSAVLKQRAYVLFYTRCDSTSQGKQSAPSTPASSPRKKAAPSQSHFQSPQSQSPSPVKPSPKQPSANSVPTTSRSDVAHRSPQKMSTPSKLSRPTGASPSSNFSTPPPTARGPIQTATDGTPNQQTSPITPLRFPSPAIGGSKSPRHNSTPKVSVQSQPAASSPGLKFTKAECCTKSPNKSAPALEQRRDQEDCKPIVNSTDLKCNSDTPGSGPSPSGIWAPNGDVNRSPTSPSKVDQQCSTPKPSQSITEDEEMLELSSESESDDEPIPRLQPKRERADNNITSSDGKSRKQFPAPSRPSVNNSTTSKAILSATPQQSPALKPFTACASSVCSPTLPSAKKVSGASTKPQSLINSVDSNKSCAPQQKLGSNASLATKNKLAATPQLPNQPNQPSSTKKNNNTQLPPTKKSNIAPASDCNINQTNRKPMSSTGFGANGKDSVAIRNAEESKTQNSSVAKEKGGNSNETSASDSVHSKRTATNPSTSLNGVIGLAASKRKILSSGSETARKKVENAFRRGEATSGDVVSKRPCAGDKVSKRPSTGDGSTKIERKRSFPSPSSKLGEEGDGQAATDTEKVKIGSTFLDSDSKDVATNADNKTIKNKTLGSQNGSSSKKPDGVTAADSKTVKSIGPLLSSTNGSTYNSSDRRTQDVSKEKANNPSKVISTSRPSTALGSSELFGAQGVDQWNLGTEGDKQTSDNSSVGESHAQPGDGQKQQEVPQQHQRQKSYVRPKITKRRRANDELDAEYDKGRTPRKARRGNNDGANGMNCFDVASERRRTADTVGAAEINKA